MSARSRSRDRLPDPKRSRHSEVASSSSRRHRSPSEGPSSSYRRDKDRERERGDRDRDRDYGDRRRDRDRDYDRRGDRDRDYDRRERDRDPRDRHDRERERDRPRDKERERERERDRPRDERERDRPRSSATVKEPAPITTTTASSTTNGGGSPALPHTPTLSNGSASPFPAFASPAAPTAEEEKQRLKREKLEAWKKQREDKKRQEESKAKAEEVKARVEAVAAAKGLTKSTGAAAGTSASGGISLGGLPSKPAFALQASTLSRIGLPVKPSFAGLTLPSTSTKKSLSMMDDSDSSDRKLQKLSLPPVDPLVAPGATAEPVGENLEDADEDDEDDEDAMDVDVPAAGRRRLTAARRRLDEPSPEDKMDVDPKAGDDDEDEEDPLDAFMKENTKTVKLVNEEDEKRFGVSAETSGRLVPLGAEEDDDEEDDKEQDSGHMTAEQILALAAKKARKKDLPPPDHSQITYEPFRKAFYISAPDTDDMDEEDVELMRMEMDGIKIRGKDCPKPVTHWGALGLPAGCYDVIKRLGYERPTPIQAQAVPAIMSGRDIIGVAKTGSGKTIAFLLPMFRHIKDQRPLENGEGPMAIVMTPTRELATQIWRESKPFMTALGMRAVCVYGGSPLAEQIADMKKGCEVVVCTPGRMIDLLTANSGRVTNVRRVTYMVLDEADRMFDMGFEPQVMKIISNVRPDRQTVLFSATFPQKMDALARKILIKPLEITVGGRSVVAKEIDQRVEIRTQDTKWLRLLELLGEMGEEHKDDADDFRTLIFVERQESADELFQNLMQKGYICASLHGGKDQVDRDQAISDFKAGYIPIVIATSVAARGLDVKELKLVVNYDCPNHMEDYIHRAGRTGRAGNKGTCITFITPEQDKFSVDIVRALKASEAYVSPDLEKLADDFLAKVKAGKAKTAGSGFGGKGLDKLEEEREGKDRAQRAAYGEDGGREDKPETALVKASEARAKRTGDAGTGSNDPTTTTSSGPADADYTFSDFKVEIVKGPAPERVAAANAKAAARNPQFGKDLTTLPPQTLAALQKAEAAGKGGNVMENLQSAVAKITAALNKSKAATVAEAASTKKDLDATDYHAIVPINDYPQKARWKATNKEQMVQLQDISGASITNKGLYYEPGKEPGPGQEPKLYLLIESNDEYRVRAAVDELRRILVETSVHVLQNQDREPMPAGRYRV